MSFHDVMEVYRCWLEIRELEEFKDNKDFRDNPLEFHDTVDKLAIKPNGVFTLMRIEKDENGRRYPSSTSVSNRDWIPVSENAITVDRIMVDGYDDSPEYERSSK